MTNSTRNRFQNRFQNRCGTRSGTTDQNQNQNQTVVKGFCGWSVAKKSSNATACIGRDSHRKADGGYADSMRGGLR